MTRATGERLCAVGHVTLDASPDGPRPGGSVTFASRVWRAFGAAPRVVTAAGPDFPVAAVDGLIRWQPSAVTTRFLNTYDAVGGRAQRLLALAPPVRPTSMSPLDALFLAPVLGEVEPRAWLQVPARLRAAGLQGWLKRSVDGVVRHGPDAVQPALFAGLDLAFLSDEDLAGDDSWLARLRGVVPCVVLTQGAAGCTVFAAGRATQVRAGPARAIDPTGAGDTFAAAFILARVRGLDLRACAVVAHRAAAAAIGWPGVPPMAAFGGTTVGLAHALAPAACERYPFP